MRILRTYFSKNKIKVLLKKVLIKNRIFTVIFTIATVACFKRIYGYQSTSKKIERVETYDCFIFEKSKYEIRFD